jgi:hypothetical protein
VPTIVVSGAIEKLTNVLVDPHSHFPPEGFVCLWWYAIESRSFAWLELVDGLIHFTKRDRAINFHQLFSLGDKVKDAEVNWSMITDTHSKCGPKTATFLLLLDARVPSGSRIAMLIDFL